MMRQLWASNQDHYSDLSIKRRRNPILTNNESKIDERLNAVMGFVMTVAVLEGNNLSLARARLEGVQHICRAFVIFETHLC